MTPQPALPPPLRQRRRSPSSSIATSATSQFSVRDDLFAPDTFYDLLPPCGASRSRDPVWRSASSCAPSPRVPSRSRWSAPCPTSSGFVTEHVETQHRPGGDVVARRMHVCEVRDGQICAATTYCNGGWNDELRARHAAEAPMIRP